MNLNNNIKYFKSLIDEYEKANKHTSTFLHGNVAPTLCLIKMQMDLLILGFKKKGKPTDELKKNSELLDEVIENLRVLSRDLFPSLLNVMGLSKCMKSLCSKLSEKNGFEISLNTEDIIENELPFSEQEKFHVYLLFSDVLQFLVPFAGQEGIEVEIFKTAADLYLEFHAKVNLSVENKLKVKSSSASPIDAVKARLLIIDAFVLDETDWKQKVIIGIPFKSEQTG